MLQESTQEVLHLQKDSLLLYQRPVILGLLIRSLTRDSAANSALGLGLQLGVGLLYFQSHVQPAFVPIASSTVPVELAGVPCGSPVPDCEGREGGDQDIQVGFIRSSLASYSSAGMLGWSAPLKPCITQL